MAVASAFAGAGVGGTDERQPKHRPAQQVSTQMFHAQMTKFVADVKAHAVGVLVHRIDYVRHQYDELRTEEFGGKRIEAAIAIQDVSLRAFLVLQAIATNGVSEAQIGELCF